MSTESDSSFGTKSSRRRARYLARQNRELISQLVQIRKDAGLKQSDVATLLGNTQQAISEFERMLKPASLSRISNYAHAVGALVSHHVAMDRGQLEAHGDRWVRFVELPVLLEANFRQGLQLPFAQRVREDAVKATGFNDAGPTMFAGANVVVATDSHRTDFALSA